MSTINWLAFIIPMVIMLLLPFGLAFFFHRRFLVPWSIFFIAAGFCLISLLVQFSFIALQLVEYTLIVKLHLHLLECRSRNGTDEIDRTSWGWLAQET